MTRKLHGRVRGKTIELLEDAGVADGQEVELQMNVVSRARKVTGSRAGGRGPALRPTWHGVNKGTVRTAIIQSPRESLYFPE